MKTTAKVTMRAVAKEAQVAMGTVSRVLNFHDDVDPVLAQRVAQAVRAIGYVHRPQSRTKQPRRKPLSTAGDVGVLFLGESSNTANRSEAMGMLQHVERALALRRRNLFVGSITRELRVPDFLIRRHVEGVILINLHGEAEDVDWIKTAYSCVKHFPHVWMHARPLGLGGDLCSPDFRRAGILAAEYLVRTGHRWAGHFHLEPDSLGGSFMIAAFSANARQHSINVTDLGINRADEALTPEEATSRLFDRLTETAQEFNPTAVFIPDYDIALQLAERLAAMRGPVRDLCLLSCIAEGQSQRSRVERLTLIDLRLDCLGTRAVEQLLWRMGDSVGSPDCLNLSVEPALIECEPTRVVLSNA